MSVIEKVPVMGIFLVALAIGLSVVIVGSNQVHNERLEEKKNAAELEVLAAPEIDIECIKSYIHGWNMAAYANKSDISFHANINEDGDYVFTAVNVRVNFDNPAEILVHKELTEQLAHDWFILTGSKLVRLINPEGFIIFWCDKGGTFFLLAPEKKEEKKEKVERRNV